MASSRSAEEARAESISMMGPDLGALYHELSNEVSWLHLKWNRFRALFGEEEERIYLMNDTAPAFFRQFQRLLLDDILLHMSCLTGPARSSGKDNLALARLSGLLQDVSLRSEVAEKLKQLSSLCGFAEDQRHRRLAHRDLALAMKAVDHRPLEAATREKIELALVGIRGVMNTVLGHFKESVVRYESTIAALGDVDSLLHYLKRGQQAEQECFDALRASVNPHELCEEKEPAQRVEGFYVRIGRIWRKTYARIQALCKPRI